jgi:hypothetical protein
MPSPASIHNAALENTPPLPSGTNGLNGALAKHVIPDYVCICADFRSIQHFLGKQSADSTLCPFLPLIPSHVDAVNPDVTDGKFAFP